MSSSMRARDSVDEWTDKNGDVYRRVEGSPDHAPVYEVVSKAKKSSKKKASKKKE
jgi:hypothetical protein